MLNFFSVNWTGLIGLLASITSENEN